MKPGARSGSTLKIGLPMASLMLKSRAAVR
jgi:hypothetical protein